MLYRVSIFTCIIILICTVLNNPNAYAADKDQLLNLAEVPVNERNPIAKKKVWPKKVGEANICLWKDDKIAAFTFTIDDNTKPDHAWWLEQGKKYGFRFTWFVVTTGLVNKINPKFSGTWNDFQALLDNGHDVQSHTVSHRSKKDNLPIDEDYLAAIKQIDDNIKGARCMTMAYPGGGLDNDPKIAAKYFAGARGARCFPNNPSPNYLETIRSAVSNHPSSNREKAVDGPVYWGLLKNMTRRTKITVHGIVSIYMAYNLI